MDQKQKAAALVLHLKAAGEKFEDEEYVAHEIEQLCVEAFRAGAASTKFGAQHGDMVSCDPAPHAAAGAPIITGRSYKL